MEKTIEAVTRVARNQIDKMLTSPGKEDAFTKMIERQTEKIPSVAFLALGIGSIGASLALKSMGYSKTANFVGMWAPTILVMGLYNKIVKVEGSERHQLH